MDINKVREQTQRELKIFCENVKYLRQSNQLSQKEMANIMRISNSIRRIETGDLPNIGANAIVRTSAHFHLHPADLFRTDWR